MDNRVYYTKEQREKGLDYVLNVGNKYRLASLVDKGEIVRLDDWEKKVIALMREAQYREDPQEDKLIAMLEDVKKKYVKPETPRKIKWYQPGPDGW